MKRMRSTAPILEQFESIVLLSALRPVKHAMKHLPAHIAPHRPGHVAPSVTATTRLNGTVSGPLVAPVLDNAPWSWNFQSSITINRTIYPAAQISGTYDTASQTGRLIISTADGQLETAILTLTDYTGGHYQIKSGTGNFANAVGSGVMMMTLTTTTSINPQTQATETSNSMRVSFNPHQYR